MRALLSVWDKTGIAAFAQRLHQAGFEIVSTGGTLRTIEDAGVPVRAVSDVTGFPEILEGRVKTLHPAIHGGLLARRDITSHMQEIQQHDITPIDLVVGNLYPFADVVSQDNVSLEQALEHIDIGGPSMIRAAAKNFPSVIVVVDPADQEWIADALNQGGLDAITLEQRRALAAKAFAHVSGYDSIVASYLQKSEAFPERLTFSGDKVTDLRYGENPHQSAALYRLLTPEGTVGAGAWQLRQGPEMSYNNYLDANAALNAALEFSDTAVTIIKHTVPCGIAVNADQAAAYEAALESDPVSVFGGVIALNRPLTVECARKIAERRYDILIAPGFEPESLEVLRRRKNLRIVEVPDSDLTSLPDVRIIDGALLLQTPDRLEPDPSSWQTVTERTPSEEEIRSLVFAWKAVRHVKSNAIVLAVGQQTVGIGGGQPNRVDASRMAVERAGERAKGAVLASDAFFPFADGLEVAAAAGVTAVAQPGGAVRDDEIIEAANRAGVAMVFTGVRHFRH